MPGFSQKESDHRSLFLFIFGDNLGKFLVREWMLLEQVCQTSFWSNLCVYVE